jgi:hypothetical protein
VTHPLRRRSVDERGWEADRALLTSRLRTLGLPREIQIRLHANRAVMVSLTPRGTLRIHRGYAYASDRTLAAVVKFLWPGAGRTARADARRIVLAHDVERYVTSRRSRPRRKSPGDRPLVAALERWCADLNRQHFDSALPAIPIRLSSRMTTRLGELSVDTATGRAEEIAISRRHVQEDPPEDVRDTLLHEMVHQWQAEQGHRPDHGRLFREKARALGIVPAARKVVGGIRTD